ncbi:MAG: HDOD domain-containing protein [Burkholderiales bacterium]
MAHRNPMPAVRAEPEPAAARERRILACAARLPSPPEIVLALVGAIDNDGKGAEQIAALAERDQALTVRLLKISNSSYYGLTGQVGTVRDAVVILGFSSVRNLVIATEIANCYGGLPAQRVGLADFWRHGLLSALCAAELARRCGAEEGHAFTGGMLHDIGQLVLASAYPEEFRALLAAPPGAVDALALERECFGMDHAALGGWIAERWHFPGAICAALRGHHQPHPSDPLACLLRSADRIAQALDAPASGGAALQACADALVALGTRHTAPELLADIERRAGAAAELFESEI